LKRGTLAKLDKFGGVPSNGADSGEKNAMQQKTGRKGDVFIGG
jgi:hypothetical protein